jgi:hypothetical protein
LKIEELDFGQEVNIADLSEEDAIALFGEATYQDWKKRGLGHWTIAIAKLGNWISHEN